MSRTYRSLPEAKTGYALDNQGGFWSVIVPTETTNLVPNPHNKDSLSMSAGGAFFYEDETEFAFYKFSQRVEPDPLFDSTVYYAQSIAISAGAHTFSIYIKAPEGLRFNLNVTPAISHPPTSNHAQSQPYTGTGFWKQYHVSWTHTLASSVYLSVHLLDDTEERSFYLDAWQLEALPYPTTFCDGDQRGYSNLSWLQEYRWNGAPHWSTSTRHRMSRSGGRIVNLRDEAFFHTTQIVGAGFGEFELHTTDLGNGKIIHNGMQAKGREIVISGVLYGETFQQLQTRRRKLINLFRPDTTPDQQMVLLQYQPVNINGASYGFPIVIPVAYVSGLSGTIDNHYNENLALTLRAYDDWREVTQNFYHLTMSSEITFTAIALRDYDEWDDSPPVLTDTNDYVFASVWYNSDKLFVAGDDVTLGVSDGVVDWESGTWDQSLSVNGPIYDMTKLNGFYDGHIGIVGDFSIVNAANPSNVFLLTVSTDTIVSITDDQGFPNPVRSIACTGNGTIYLGGEFTTTVQLGVDPPVLANHIIKYNPFSNQYSAIGSGYANNGFPGIVYSIVVGPDGNIYFGGSFNGLFSTDGVGLYITKYIPGTDLYELIGDGVNNTVRSLAFSENGTLYIGGDFTSNLASTRTISYLAQWGGGLIQEISGLNDVVMAIAVDSKGNLHVGGLFTDNPVGDSYYGVWNGTAWIKAEISIPRPVYSISIAPDDSIFIGTRDMGDTVTYAPIVDTITYNGTAEMSPSVTIEDIGYLEYITNLTTGTSIYFKDLYIDSYEKATIDLTPGNIKFSSNARGNLMGYVVPSSNLSEWKLLPGENRILSYMRVNGVSSEIYLSGSDKHHGIDVAGEL